MAEKLKLTMLLALMLGLAACSAHTVDAPLAGALADFSEKPGTLVMDSLPTVAGLGAGRVGPARTASGQQYSATIYGDSYHDTSSNSSTSSQLHSTTLMPDSANMSWGVWQLAENGSIVLDYSVEYEADPGAEIYLGVANFLKGRWDFQPAPASGELLTVKSEQRAANGGTYVCLLATGNMEVTVKVFICNQDNGWDSVETGIELQKYILQSPLAAVNAASHPAVAYYGSEGLMYLRSQDPDGTQPDSWGDPVLVAADAKGQWMDMQLVNGNPAIVFHDEDLGQLRYVRCSTPEGMQPADWPEPVKLDDAFGGHVPECSLAVVSGNPAVAYYSVDKNLSYRRSSTPDGNNAADWQAVLSVYVKTGVTSINPTLAVIRGKPAIAFYDRQNHSHCFMASNTVTGTEMSAWEHSPAVILSGEYLERDWSCLVSLDGKPTMRYITLQDGDISKKLRFSQAESGNGNAEQDWTKHLQSNLSIEPGSGMLSHALCSNKLVTAMFQLAVKDLEIQVIKAHEGGIGYSVYTEYPDLSLPGVLTIRMFDNDGEPGLFYVRDDEQLIYGRDSGGGYEWPAP